MNMIIKKGSLVALSIALLCAITYVVLPAINMHSVGFWLLAAAVILIATGVYAIAGDAQKEKNRIGLKIGGGLIALIAIILVIGGISGSKLVNAKAYAAIMEVSLQPAEEYQISLDEVPLMDKATSTLLANRKMGTLVELVSQFEVDEYNNTQINYQGNPVRVIPLRYSGFIKWMANQTDGIPGYIIVDMKTQEAILVEVEGGINYSPSAYFGHNLARYVWMNSPTELYGGYSLNRRGGKPGLDYAHRKKNGRYVRRHGPESDSDCRCRHRCNNPSRGRKHPRMGRHGLLGRYDD